MLTLYIIRHGTKLNREGVLHGHIDSPLTSEGITDALAMAQVLNRVSFDAVYSSDLKRARQTSEIILKKLHSHKPLICVKELREVNFGKLAGLKPAEAKHHYPLYKKKASFTFPEGESYKKVQKRVVRFVQSLEKLHECESLLIVTHAGCIRCLLSALRSTQLDKNLRMPLSNRFIAKVVIHRGKLLCYTKLSN